MFTSFLVRGDFEKEGFQIHPEEESGVDFGRVRDGVFFDDGGSEGVVFGEAELVGVDVGICEVGRGKERGGYVVGDGWRVGEETVAR